MRPTRLTLLSLAWVLAGLPSCQGDGDGPGEGPGIDLGGARGPISDWPEQRLDAGGGASGEPSADPSETEPPALEEPATTGDAGVDFGGLLPARDSGAGAALDAGLSDPPVTLDAGMAAEADADADAAQDAGDAGDASLGE